MIWIEERARAFFVPVGVAVDVLTARGEAYAVVLLEAALLDAHAEARIHRTEAGVVLGTVRIEITGDAAVHAALRLAREAQHTVKAGVAARRDLDTAIAFIRNFHAIAPRRTVRRRVAGAAARKDTLLDR
jgi:hypothetical protein